MKIVPAFAVLAVAILAIVEAPYLMAKFQLSKANNNVATAFATRRTTAMRLTSVQYSQYNPFPREMGGESGRELDEMPPELTSASGAAKEKLKSDKADPHWLQVQGRALLWASTPGSLERAEKDFETARAEGLNSPSLEIDLAASYFERDIRSEHPNLQRTLNLLNEVLTKPALGNEDRATALFNLAIAYEKTQAWDMAASTWEKYLEVDSSSGWANEAKEHLQGAKAKTHGAGQSELMTPDRFLQEPSNNQLEEYQDAAITAWLPDGVGKQDSESLRAAHAVAELLVKKHSDPWLADFLSRLQLSDVPALKALASAVEENGQGKHDEALKEAKIASQNFKLHGNRSGEFRAGIEEVNASRRALNGPDCLARASPLWSRLSHTPYHWLAARLAVEIAECGNLAGAFAESDANLQTSSQIAQQYDFPLLELRDIGLSAGNNHLRGNCNESWRESVDGLGVYWQKSQNSPLRLFQFYSVMFQCAKETGSLYAAEAFLRHAIATRNSLAEKNSTIDGMLRLSLANILTARGANNEAELERKHAAVLIDPKKLPPRYDLTLQLEQAEFQLEHGDANLALVTLLPLRNAENPDKFFALDFNQTLGNTFLKLGRLDEAGAAYEQAIKTSEAALNSIADGNKRLQWLRSTDESYRGLVRVLIEQKRPEEALERWELYRSRPMLQARASGITQKLNVDKHVELIPKTAHENARSAPILRLVYADFDDGLHIWVSQNQSIRGQWVNVEKQEVENTIREFVEKCATDSSNLDEVQQLGAKLFSFMVQPVIKDIAPSGTVIVELDQQAYNLPLEALRTPDGHYLGEKYSLVYSPGTWMEKSLRAPVPFNGQESLLLIDASHVPDAGYLPGLEAQRAAIKTLFPHTRVVDSAKVSWGLAQPLLATSDVIHYMGHGRPDGSGTKLDYEPGHPLRVKDFSPEMLRRARMVVLAACSGAAGRENGLADSNNLVRAFLGAGVPIVIASHWKVDSSYTSKLMIGFYQHLRNNETVALAMYNARIDIMREKSHPYFWAGFALGGRVS
ncbi:MAG TPA: CHAT domain-containing protein [Candidatus Angelobacter sp.]|nr:CHAT domain-containing protein [Candidatus Angelobacter sp.]